MMAFLADRRSPYRYQANFFLGTILSTWIEFGLSYVPGNPQFQWRVPMALQALPSVLVLAFIWFIPETPRTCFPFAKNSSLDRLS
jgi:hypothetical protein